MKTKSRSWKLCSILLSLALLGTLLAGCGDKTTSEEGGAAVKPKEIVLGHVYSESHNANLACIEFKKYVEEASGGSLKVNIQANSVLGGDEAMLEMCAIGTVNLMIPSTASLEMYSPDWAIASIPYLYNSVDEMDAALDGDLGDYLKETLEDTEYICVGFNSNGTRNMSNNVHPITQVSDMKGLKMRVMNSPTYVTWMNALGANATPMGFDEVFTGLQQGTVQGQENSPSMTYEAKFQEVQKYYSVTEHVFDQNAIIANRAFYESLTPEEKTIYDFGISEYMIKYERKLQADSNDEFIQKLADSGMEINYLSDEAKEGFRAALANFYANARKTLGEEIFSLVEQYQ